MYADSQMDLTKATTELTSGPKLHDVAKAMGITAQALRQSRLAEGNPGRRNVDDDKLRSALILLAEREAKRLTDLAKQLKQGT